MNLINIAADLMSGSDDVTVTRTPDGQIREITWSHNGEPVEYLRGMVEVITEAIGFTLQEGRGRDEVTAEILHRSGITVTEA